MGYKVKTRVRTITQNTTITETDFGGWMCVNTGTAAVEVNKVPLQPSEGLDFTACVPPDTHWDSPIQIVIPTPGGQVTITQLIYKDDKKDSPILQLLKQIAGKTVKFKD